MSLRSIGNQLIQTVPSPLLAGASTVSLSLWVRVNPGCNVANPSGVNIFGDTGGKVSATLSGTGGLQLGWSSNNGTSNVQSICNLALSPGTSYHLASVWQDGSQQYFVNGVEIDSDAQKGSIGVLGDVAPHPFRLGSDSAGTDVSLDEPTLWVGYALNAQDVRNIRDRIVHPEGIAPASIALQWSLAGADGVSAQVGDAGLTDSSATGLNLSSVVGTAPTYQAGVLSYAPVAKIGKASVAPSGRAIIVVVEDGASNPANVASLKSTDSVQQLALSGVPPDVTPLPTNYGIWTVPVTAGVPYQIATNWLGNNVYYSAAQVWQFFDSDGVTLLGTATTDMTINSVGLTDGVSTVGDHPFNWQTLGTFTATGAAIKIRVTSPVNTYFLVDALRVENTVTSAVQKLDDQDGSFVVVAPDGSNNPGTDGIRYDNTYTNAKGTGTPATTSGFTLTFDGQTTDSIPAIAHGTLNYGIWTVPVTAGVAYQIATSWIGNNVYYNAAQVWQFFDSDGVTLLGTATTDMTINSIGLAGGESPGGHSISWQTLGTFTATGTAIKIKVTSPYDGTYFLVDALRSENTVTNSVQILDDHDGSFAVVAPDGSAQIGTDPIYYDGTYTNAKGTGTGTHPVADPAAIQSALLALSSVQAGGLTVTASDSSNSPPYTIRFVGPMAKSAQPTITCADPDVTMSVIEAGGVFPSIKINGGPPILLKDPVWGSGLQADGVTPSGYPPYSPYLLWPLAQSGPLLQIVAEGDGNFSTNGNGNPFNGNYTYQTFAIYGNSDSAWLFPSQQAGTYRVAVTWFANPSFSTAARYVVTGDSATLTTITVDQTVAPSDFTDRGVGWKILGEFTVAAGTDIQVTIYADGVTVDADTARLDRTSADTSIVIGPTDTVTLDAVDGWATTASGPVDGATSLVLENLVGGSNLPPFAAIPKTMKVGYNVQGENDQPPILLYSNIAKRIGWNSYPTQLNGPYQDGIQVGVPSQDKGGNSKGLDSLPYGHYTFKWDGACDLTPQATNGTSATPVAANITGTTDNYRVYNFQSGGYNFSPWVLFRLHGTTPVDPANPAGAYHCDLANLRIYPPDPSDPTGMTAWGVDSEPPKFHPSRLAKMTGMKGLRFLDPMSAIAGNAKDYSDFATPESATYILPNRTLEIPIVEIRQYTGSTPAAFASKYVVIQVTTSVPHTLVSGQGGQAVNSDNARISDGSSFYVGYTQTVVQVISPTVFLMNIAGGDPGRTMTNVLTTTAGQFQVNIGGNQGMPFEDMPEYCNANHCDFYLNIPAVVTDDCVTRMADYVAANLAAGLKCRVEYVNEAWNFNTNVYAACCMLGMLELGVGPDYPEAWYVYRMSQIHEIFAARFAAAGRPGDFVRVMGTQGGYSGWTQQLLAEATSGRYPSAVPVDELAVATYLDNMHAYYDSEPSLTPTYNLMTTDQFLDLYEMNVLYGQLSTFVSQHRQPLDAAGYASTKIICYEGGPQNTVPNDVTTDLIGRYHAVVRHPRMYGVMLQLLQDNQDAGCTLYHDYIDSYPVGGPQWGAYFGWDQQPGTGDPTLDAINIADPEAVDQVKSEVGGAMNRWASLVEGSTPVSPVKPKRILPGRNGQIKATGFPRGLFRSTR